MAYLKSIQEVVEVVARNQWALRNIRATAKRDLFIATYGIRTQNLNLVQEVFKDLQEETGGGFYLHQVFPSTVCHGVDIVYSIDQRMLL